MVEEISFKLDSEERNGSLAMIFDNTILSNRDSPSLMINLGWLELNLAIENETVGNFSLSDYSGSPEEAVITNGSYGQILECYFAGGCSSVLSAFYIQSELGQAYSDGNDDFLNGTLMFESGSIPANEPSDVVLNLTTELLHSNVSSSGTTVYWNATVEIQLPIFVNYSISSILRGGVYLVSGSYTGSFFLEDTMSNVTNFGSDSEGVCQFSLSTVTFVNGSFDVSSASVSGVALVLRTELDDHDVSFDLWARWGEKQ